VRGSARSRATSGRSYHRTKSAKATKGEQVSLATGSAMINSTEARVGAAPGDGLASPHQVLPRSQHDLFRNIRVDPMARARTHDDSLDPGVVLIDTRLAWRPTLSGEVSISVQDLANRQAIEYYPEIATPAIPVRRTFILRRTQRF
jgi:hypothetical protein